MEGFSARRLVYALLSFVAVLLVGTAGFHALTDEGWVESLYRSVVTTTLTGLDTKPEGTDAQIFSILLLLAGVAIFLYIAGAVVELIARGVVVDAFGRRRRRRVIEQLHGHTIGVASAASAAAPRPSSSPRASRSSSSTRTRNRSPRRRRSARSSFTATAPTTPTSSGPASLARARSSPRPTRTSTTSTSRFLPAPRGPSCRSSRVPPTRRRHGSSASSGPTGSSSRTRARAYRSRTSC